MVKMIPLLFRTFVKRHSARCKDKIYINEISAKTDEMPIDTGDPTPVGYH